MPRSPGQILRDLRGMLQTDVVPDAADSVEFARKLSALLAEADSVLATHDKQMVGVGADEIIRRAQGRIAYLEARGAVQSAGIFRDLLELLAFAAPPAPAVRDREALAVVKQLRNLFDTTGNEIQYRWTDEPKGYRWLQDVLARADKLL